MAKVLIGNVKGPQGDAATVTVGTVTTGAAGSDAAVTNSGTSSEATFNFTIPRGATGAPGTPGVTDYATASAAGLVRIGSDFNIDSSTGTISENNTFTQASSLAEINSGDAHATILGKIKKFMNTLMPSSFLVNTANSTATDKALTANMGHVIAGDIATVETSTTASKAYSAGEYLVLNGQLYKVTASIANGGTITVGTNVSATTAGAQLKSLKESLPFIGSADVTLPTGKFSSSNAHTIVKYGRVVKVYMDVTVGSSQINSWATLGTWTSDYYINNSSGLTLVMVNDVTAGESNIRSIGIPSNGLSFSIGSPLTAEHRYIISFVTVY